MSRSRFLKTKPIALASCLLALTCIVPATASAGPRKVPKGFIGIDFDPWKASARGLKASNELRIAANSGVETVRFPLYWSKVQRTKTSYSWGALDSFFAEAAKRRLNLVPTVMGAPIWAADRRYNGKRSPTKLLIPANYSLYAAFITKLALRYGSNGSFWRAHPAYPKTAVKVWQVWNEPDLPYYWPSHAGEVQTVTVNGRRVRSKGLYWAPTYVRLVRMARTALRSADPRAQLMLGSMTNQVWGPKGLRLAYRSGAKGSFDLVGVNIFAGTVPQLRTALGYVTNLMNQYGDRGTKLTVTELSWLAARGKLRKGTNMAWIVTDPAGQARQLKSALNMLAAYRTAGRITGAYWYSWISTYRGNNSGWYYSGLRSFGLRRGTAGSRTSLATYRATALRLEGR